MSEWQPIETAPKDGTPLILHNPRWAIDVLCGGWDTHEKAWRIYGSGCPHEQPLFWRHRPEPPK